jgi:hypothetical protein
MEVLVTNIKQKLSKKYSCEICNYTTERKSNINNHNMSAKHIKKTSGTKIKQKISNKFECENCNKIYQTSSGLWKHTQKCVKKVNTMEDNVTVSVAVNDGIKNSITPDLILQIIKQNQELQKQNYELQTQVLELCKNGTHNTTNTNTNSHNKTFNLQFFLNETCKDAMNIMDFVESIKVQLCDLEKVGQIGYVEGISNILVKNLNSLYETKRPVHCTDAKREVLYVKDEDKWEKENNDKQKLRKVIKEVAYKNSKMLKEYKTKHPDCDKGDSKFSDQYNKLIIEAMGGKGDNDVEKEDKIIKNIAKEVTIEK